MKILAIEDEEGISNFLKQGLEEEGYEVDVAYDGKEGLALALSGKYDLLLLDWMLPEISGIEVCRQFRLKFSSTPILFLTAKDTVEETILGLQAGGNDYIKKPFNFDELLERIKVQLRAKEAYKEVHNLGDISIDIALRQVFLGEKEVILTQKEFDLLAYLIKNKGKICERGNIIKDVWDIHFEYSTSVIDVYINSLRKKLQLTINNNNIQTVRGIGYIAKEK